MILLELRKRILEETILARFTAKKQEMVDVTLADFDGVQFHISTQDAGAKNLITVSCRWKCVSTLMEYGAQDLLSEVYGDLLLGTAENGYDVSLLLDLNNLPANKDDLPGKIGLFKKTLLSAVFRRAFVAIETGQAASLPEVIAIPYRDDEVLYIKPAGDSCTVIFSITFRDPNDQILSKVFLQEFADARRTMRNAPAVSLSQKEPPGELFGVAGVHAQENIGWVSFVLFKGHIGAGTRDKSIETIQTFRDYLHYHIKCAKANLHDRMRKRVVSLLQILNRAKMDVEKKKKTMSGRTFTQAEH